MSDRLIVTIFLLAFIAVVFTLAVVESVLPMEVEVQVYEGLLHCGLERRDFDTNQDVSDGAEKTYIYDGKTLIAEITYGAGPFGEFEEAQVLENGVMQRYSWFDWERRFGHSLCNLMRVVPE